MDGRVLQWKQEGQLRSFNPYGSLRSKAIKGGSGIGFGTYSEHRASRAFCKLDMLGREREFKIFPGVWLRGWKDGVTICWIGEDGKGTDFGD